MLLCIMRADGENSVIDGENIVMLRAELRVRESTAPPRK